MPQLPIADAGASLCPGEAYLADTPVLRPHIGTQPDLFLRWNAVPLDAAAIDVIVHLHGFSQQGRDMPLSEKVPRSGLDLSGRRRPTLALLPRGNWIRHYYYDFPALLGGGIDALIAYALQKFSETHPLTLPSPPLGERVAKGRRGAPPERPPLAGGRPPRAGALSVDRLILSAHSGGVMPALDILAGAQRAPDELYLFGGLYGRDPRRGDDGRDLEIIDHWLAGRLAAEPGRPGALRVVYIERETGPMSRDVAALLSKRLTGIDPAPASDLARRYRVERSAVPHAYVAAICLPQLLAESGVEFDWSRV
ncbi:MAG TPA: hypothetical protein VF007_00560 [Stellaceae bacterium]